MPKTKSFKNLNIRLVLILLAVGAASGQTVPAERSRTADPSNRRGPLQLTYIANEGVLLSSGNRKVLIDALFDKPNKEYRAPSPDATEKMMRGETLPTTGSTCCWSRTTTPTISTLG